MNVRSAGTLADTVSVRTLTDDLVPPLELTSHSESLRSPSPEPDASNQTVQARGECRRFRSPRHRPGLASLRVSAPYPCPGPMTEGGVQTARMIKRTRWHVRLAALPALALLGGCSSPNTTAISETAAVRQTEALVASYAPTHLGDNGVGGRAGCEDRIIGESTRNSGRQLYLELLCSSLTGQPPCFRTDSTAFLLQAVAAVSPKDKVTTLTLDTGEDGEGYQWVVQHFPAKWRHVESDGPKYGDLLQSRLEGQFPC
jgi:hypothetical protein